MKLILVSLFLAGVAIGQPTTLKLTSVTATSMVVEYTAPSTNACTFAVSTPTFATINDLDTTIRAGANSDAFVVYDSQIRAFVGAGLAGIRRAVVGFPAVIRVAQRNYSLTLQADTTHILIATCEGGSRTLVINTARISGIVPKAPTFVSGAHGNFGAPDPNWADLTKPTIGINGEAIYLLGDPQYFGFQRDDTFPIALGGAGYANLSNIITFGGAGATTINTNVVFVPFMTDGLSFTFGDFDSAFWYRTSNIALRVFGYGDSATAANRRVRACLTGNGVTCLTDYQSILLPQTTAATVTLSDYHSSFPTGGFAGWSKEMGGENLMTQGYVTATGTGVLTLVAGPTGGTNLAYATASRFQPTMVGSRIYVAGSSPTCTSNYCTVASFNSATQVTTTETPIVTSALYRSAHGGLLLNKETATGSVTYSVGYRTAAFKPTHQGQIPSCSPLVVPGTRAARLCLFAKNPDYFGMAVYVDPDAKLVRPISLLAAPAAIAGHAAGDLPINPGYVPNIGNVPGFDSSDAGTFYFAMQTVSGKPSLFKVVCALTATPAGLAWSYRQDGFTSGYTDPCIWTNLTKASESKDLQTQLAAVWDESKYGSLASGILSKGVSNGVAVVAKMMSGQDRPCGIFAISVTTGLLLRQLNTLNGQPGMRFLGCHAITTVGGKAIISFNRLADVSTGALFGGPFVNAVNTAKKAGVFNANTSVPGTADGTYDAACPGDLAAEWIALGATGNNCLTVRIPGQPCSAYADAAEKAAHPCPSDSNKSYIGSNIAPGDTADTGVTDLVRYTVVKVTTLTDLNSDGDLDLELVLLVDSASGYACQEANARGRQCVGITAQAAQSNGWAMQWTSRTAETSWDLATGALSYEDEWLTRGHPDYTSGGAFMGIMGFGDYYFHRAAGRAVGSRQTSTFARTVRFANVLPEQNNQQSYISAQPVVATGVTDQIVSDFPHLNGSFGVTQEASGQLLGSTMTFTLQGGTTTVYKVLPISGTYDGKRAALAVWYGYDVLGEKSSPTTASHTLTDSDVGRWCYAYRAAECRTGSLAGDLYVVAPNLDTSITRCNASQISYRSICVFALASTAATVIQMRATNDVEGRQQRIVSDSLTRPGAQYVYTHARQFPDSMTILSTAHNLAGWYTGPILIDPGRWVDDSTYRGTYSPVDVAVPANSIVEFGVDTSFRCRYDAIAGTGRNEACKAVAAAITEAAPYSFAYETLTASAAAQRVRLPLTPGRVWYYRVVTGGVPGPLQAVAVP